MGAELREATGVAGRSWKSASDDLWAIARPARSERGRRGLAVEARMSYTQDTANNVHDVVCIMVRQYWTNTDNLGIADLHRWIRKATNDLFNMTEDTPEWIRLIVEHKALEQLCKTYGVEMEW